jgi:hypothetical protein
MTTTSGAPHGSVRRCNGEEFAKMARRQADRYAKGRAGHELLTYNRATKEMVLWREPAYEIRNPEKVQDSCARKFSSEESGIQPGDRTIYFGASDFPRSLLPIRNGLDRGPYR